MESNDFDDIQNLTELALSVENRFEDILENERELSRTDESLEERLEILEDLGFSENEMGSGEDSLPSNEEDDDFRAEMRVFKNQMISFMPLLNSLYEMGIMEKMRKFDELRGSAMRAPDVSDQIGKAESRMTEILQQEKTELLEALKTSSRRANKKVKNVEEEVVALKAELKQKEKVFKMELDSLRRKLQERKTLRFDDDIYGDIMNSTMTPVSEDQETEDELVENKTNLIIIGGEGHAHTFDQLDLNTMKLSHLYK